MPATPEHTQHTFLAVIAEEIRLTRESQQRTEVHLALIASILSDSAKESRHLHYGSRSAA